MSEPQRMQDSDEIPSALREAFGALGREAPSSQTVLRVERALQTLPAVAPAVATVTFSMGKLLVLATLAAGAVSSAVVLMRAAPHVTERAEQVPVQPVALEAAVATAAPSDPALVSPAVPAAIAPPEPNKPPIAEPRGPLSSVGWRAKGRAPTPGAPDRPGLHPSSSPRALASAPQLEAEREAIAPASEAAPAATPAALPTAPVRPAALQTNEAERLAQCKRLALRQPEQALQQLELLARELPNGAFLQERELLAIRLHERLSHHATAEQLAQQFRDRYPSSVYQRVVPP